MFMKKYYVGHSSGRGSHSHYAPYIRYGKNSNGGQNSLFSVICARPFRLHFSPRTPECEFFVQYSPPFRANTRGTQFHDSTFMSLQQKQENEISSGRGFTYAISIDSVFQFVLKSGSWGKFQTLVFGTKVAPNNQRGAALRRPPPLRGT